MSGATRSLTSDHDNQGLTAGETSKAGLITYLIAAGLNDGCYPQEGEQRIVLQHSVGAGTTIVGATPRGSQIAKMLASCSFKPVSAGNMPPSLVSAGMRLWYLNSTSGSAARNQSVTLLLRKLPSLPSHEAVQVEVRCDNSIRDCFTQFAGRGDIAITNDPLRIRPPASVSEFLKSVENDEARVGAYGLAVTLLRAGWNCINDGISYGGDVMDFRSRIQKIDESLSALVHGCDQQGKSTVDSARFQGAKQLLDWLSVKDGPAIFAAGTRLRLGDVQAGDLCLDRWSHKLNFVPRINEKSISLDNRKQGVPFANARSSAIFFSPLCVGAAAVALEHGIVSLGASSADRLTDAQAPDEAIDNFGVVDASQGDSYKLNPTVQPTADHVERSAVDGLSTRNSLTQTDSLFAL